MSWFQYPSELFRSDKILEFWPNASQSAAERINASTRFILYLSCILYLIKRDPRILLLAVMVITVLYVFDKSGNIKGPDGIPTSGLNCQLPTDDNAMGNVLLSDYTDDPARSPACYYPTVAKKVSSSLNKLYGNLIEYGPTRSRGGTPDEQRRAFDRAFVSMPVSNIPGDQTAFAEWVYGKKFQPLCRDDPSKCDPNYWGAQTEAYAGLDSGMNPRGGRGSRMS